MTIQIEDVIYTIPEESFTSCDGSVCIVQIFYDENLGEMIEVGLPFFENFVTVYDYSNGKIRLGLSVNAVEGALIDPATPWDDLVTKIKNLTGWEIFGIIVGIFLTIVFLIFCIGYLCHCAVER